MPCLILVGHPSAGKSTLAKLLKQRALLHDAIDEVVILNEESECGCVENDVSRHEVGESSSADNNNKNNTAVATKEGLYGTSLAEKQTRGALKAAFDRAVKKTGGSDSSSRRLVILDSLNYIKGFRYELHCISKASGDKHGILWVLNRLSVVQQWNKNYSSGLLLELISRFEPPDERNRWDKPLFTVDIAAAMKLSSSNEDEEGQINKLSSKNEVLENSVYNMHALGEAFGNSPATERNDNAVGASSAGAGSQRPSKSAFARSSKAPKKSAFQRRKKASPPTEKDETKQRSGYNQENKIIFDTSIITSQAQNSTAESEKVTRGGKSTPTPIPSSKPTTSSQSNEATSSKSLEEQLDEILNVFLLQTQNLKEGMSTRQYV
jgi:tRNA uridine 5-carbamoylmethylation protein Kti12